MSSSLSVLLEAPSVTELWQVPTSELGSLVDAALRGVDRLHSLCSALVAEAVSRGIADSCGESGPRPRDWVRAQSSVSVGETEIRRILRRVKTRSLLPGVTTLHDTGAVSTAFLDAAAAGIHRLPADVRESLDVTLSGDARVCDPSQLPVIIHHLRAAVDPEGTNARADWLDGLSRVSLSPVGSDGAYALDGVLYGLQAERFANLLATHAERLRRDGFTGSSALRRAQALFRVAGIAERAGQDVDHLAPPHGALAQVTVISNTATWHGETGAPAAVTGNGHTVDPGQVAALRCTQSTHPDLLTVTTDPADPTFTTDPAEITDTVSDADAVGPAGAADADPLLGGTSQAMMDAAWFRRQLTGLAPAPLGLRLIPLALYRDARKASPGQWQGLIARDRHCVIPGCTRPPIDCQAHHTREWDEDTGNTNLEELALVCWHHHAWLHRLGQHLHPPWCHCATCTRDRYAGYPDDWTLHTHAPEIRVSGQQPADV